MDVSVCVPTYQGAPYLEACLESIAGQDLAGVEVLVCDDGSTDATVAIATAFGDRIPDLDVAVNPTRLGAVANLNHCIARARGAWVKPVFQDDLIAPGCLTALREARGGSPVVVAGRRYLYEPGVPDWRRDACEHLLEVALDRRFPPGPVTPDAIADVLVDLVVDGVPQLNPVGEPVAVMLERDAVLAAGGFDAGYVQLWDYELVLRLAVQHGLVVVPGPLATFRVHGQSQTTRNFDDDAYRTEVLDPLRLLVGYATRPEYDRPRRRATARAEPVSLPERAAHAAATARRALADLPSAGRDDAEAAWWQEVAPLDGAVAVPSAAGGATGLRRAVRFARRLVRGGEWWAHMVGPILTFAYLQVGWRSVPPGTGVPSIVALVVSASAVAAYGFAVNDASDVEADRRAGKPNAMARLPRAGRVVVVGALALVGAVPWTMVALPRDAAVVLAAIYLVPLLYSPRPVRLKERDLLGPFADAANAFVLPALFTVALFAGEGGPIGPAPLMTAAIVAWSAGYGLRAILVHQIGDLPNDERSGTVTLVRRIGADRATRAVSRVVFPVELFGLAGLGVTVALWSWGAAAAGLAYLVVDQVARRAGAIGHPVSPVPAADGYVSLMEWYRVWPALIVGLGLVVGEPWYGIVVGLHLMAFARPIRKQLGDLGRVVAATGRAVRSR